MANAVESDSDDAMDYLLAPGERVKMYSVSNTCRRMPLGPEKMTDAVVDMSKQVVLPCHLNAQLQFLDMLMLFNHMKVIFWKLRSALFVLWIIVF